MSQFIHTGFAEGIETLNFTTTKAASVILPGVGRAYARGDDVGYYAASIHTNAISVNDAGHDDLMRDIAANRAFARGGVYMGCAGFLNLSYICAMRPAAAVLFDINPLQTMFWRHVVKGLASSPTFRSFVHFMQHSGATLDQQVLKACGPVELNDAGITPVNTTPRSIRGLFREVHVTDSYPWWSDTVEWNWRGQDYPYLHMMAKNGAIGALTLDLTDAQAWDDLSNYMKTAGREVCAIYVSNALTFLERGLCWSQGEYNPHAAQSAHENFNRLARGASPFIIDDQGSVPLKNALRLSGPA